MCETLNGRDGAHKLAARLALPQWGAPVEVRSDATSAGMVADGNLRQAVSGHGAHCRGIPTHDAVGHLARLGADLQHGR